MPGALLVDEKNELVFVSDVENSQIHSFDFDGELVSSTTTPSAATSMAFKSGSYMTLAELTPPATASTASTIGLSVSLRDRYGDPLSPDYDIAPEMSRLSLTAYGTIQVSDDVQIPIPIEGAVSLDAATVNITFAGEWRLELMENFALFSQHVGSSPLTFTVDPGPTALSACTLDYDSSIAAGDTLKVTLKTLDEYDNPTDHSSDVFTAEARGEVNEFSRSAGGTYTMSHLFTQAGAAIFKIPGVGQFGLDVSPSDPDAPSSTHSINAGTELVSEKEQLLDLRVFPKDEFDNAITDATGYNVSIDGGDDAPLTAPDFFFTHTIEAGFDGEVEVSFTLDGVDIKDSPVTIKVKPVDTIKTEIAAVVFVVLALASLVFNRHQQAKAKRDMVGMTQAGMAKVAKMADQQQALREQNEYLQESLEKKKHSEDELAVMKQALDGLQKKQKDELEEVLIPSSGIKVDRLLGKGGFGVVNLATYRSQKVAMKQLLTINEESVRRFR